MKFDEKSRKKEMKGDKKTEKGIMGLKFMERAQQKEKNALKAQVDLAVKQINGEDDYADSDNDQLSGDEQQQAAKGGNKFIDSANKFGVRSMKHRDIQDARQTGKELDVDKVMRAARKVTAGKEASSDSDNDMIEFEEKKQKPEKSKANKSSKAVTVQFGDDDLKHFNAEKTKLIKEKNM